MGDLSHLEKMGRELKCPICLSLLNSSASLGCNHVFCNVCIEKSMKSDSNCPVCKVPFRRREVRPAPHMDNLVSIYKSMESASGINIFVTQNVSSVKLSDADKQIEGDGNGSKRLDADISKITAYEQRISEKEPKKNYKPKLKSSPSSPVKPSFPRKKRVQVPQCPLSETPTRAVKLVRGFSEKEEEPRKNAVTLEDKGQPALSPFFWLTERDEDDKSNQQSDMDQSSNSLTMNVLSFSDIKDSLDESPSKPPTKKVCGKPSCDLDLFDSEMFEWTQRACSPELCSSPFKLQVKDIGRIEKALLAAAPNEEHQDQNPNGSSYQNGGIQDELESDVATTEDIINKDHTRCAKLIKRGRKKKESALKKCAKRSAESVIGNYSNSAMEHDVSNSLGSLKNVTKRSKKKVNFGLDESKEILENVPADPVSLSTPNENLGTETSAFPEVEKVSQFPDKKRKNGKARKKKQFGTDTNKGSEKGRQFPESSRTKGRGRKKPHFGNDANKTILEDIPAHPVNLETLIDCPENFGTEISTFQEVEKVSEFLEKGRSDGEAGREQRVVHYRRKSKKQKLDLEEDEPRRNPSVNQNQHDDFSIPDLRTAPSAIASSFDQQRGHEKQLKNSSVGIITCVYDNISQEKHDAQENRSLLFENLQCSMDGKNLDSMAKKVCSGEHEKLDNEFHCAFCLSSEESEASGKMFHYFNGQPIDTNGIKNSKVVHAHWNCVEWAPNVYFDGDTAINLEAELSRSRRIKCGCCGNKGAALGCYEKSCRKSFHVSCAKLMPQCQWDTENFVMLCPLHADSKLPCQDSGQQEQKRSCDPNRKSNTKCIAVAREISNKGGFTFRESSKKLVLCCSALTTSEKEAVAEFQKLSGVLVLPKWDDSVTHIIASTNENGACKRTLKTLMGILKGKWVLNVEWIKACMQTMEQIEEECFEITLDVHGIKDGPQLGRLRVLSNQPKLFSGFSFFFTPDFLPSYKRYLHQLVTAAGGTILLRRPVSTDQNISCFLPNCQVFIIYSLELPDECDPGERNNILNRRRTDAELHAKSAAAKVATNLWLLNSIAGCKPTSLVQ